MAIVIDLKLGGEKAVGNGLTRVADRIDDLSAKLDTLGDKLKGVFAAGRGGGAASGINATSRAATAAIGPMERYVRALRQAGIAELGGNKIRMFDANVGVARAARNLATAQRSLQPRDALADMIATARVAIGPNGKLQMMPLVNRMVSAGFSGNLAGILNFGGGGAAGAGGGATALAATAGVAAVAIAGLAIAVGGATAAFNQAKASLTDRAIAGFIGGAGGAQNAQLARLAGALGMSSTDLAQLGRSVQDRVGQGGPLMGFTAGLGANVRSGFFGNLNSTDTLLRLLRGLTDSNLSPEMAMRMSRQAGLESPVALLRAASPGMRNAALNSLGTPRSAGDIQAAADAEIALNIATKDFSEAMTTLGIQILPPVTAGIKAFSGLLNGLSAILTTLYPPGFVQRNLDNAQNFWTGHWSDLRNPFGANAPAANGGAPKALDANTQAVQMNTRAIEAQTRTIKGGGQRTNAALPKAWQGFYLEKQHDALARLQGSFTI